MAGTQPRSRRGVAGCGGARPGVAWELLAAFGAIFLATNVLSAANGDFRTQPLVEVAPLWLAFSAFRVVGATIVAHRPDNPIGWIFLAIALLAAGGGLAETYGRYAYETRPGSLPGAIVAVWFAWSSWYPTVALAVVYIPLLFPTGRLLSLRWRPVAWLAGAVTAAIVALAVLQPTFVGDSGRTVDNPIGVAAAPHPEDSTAGTVLTALLLSSMLAAFASMVVRFRRSRGEERQQLKWFTYAAALVPFVALDDLLPEVAGNLLFTALIAFLPVAAARLSLKTWTCRPMSLSSSGPAGNSGAALALEGCGCASGRTCSASAATSRPRAAATPRR